MKEQNSFKQRVEALVSLVPKGRIMTYGQIAALVGSPRASRIVGGVAHYGDPNLPWHRVVNKKGGLASGYPGGRSAHKEHLLAEGYVLKEQNGKFYVDVGELIWWPDLVGGV